MEAPHFHLAVELRDHAFAQRKRGITAGAVEIHMGGPAGDAAYGDIVHGGLGIDDAVAVVALDFDHTVLDRSARAASGAQLLAQHAQRDRVQRHPPDYGHALAATARGFAGYAGHAGARGYGRGGFALALRQRVSAIGAHAAAFSGIDQAAG
ncbi:hypothetical protein G6F65_020143 [Rhizopus arrhizus]|nr:hypothetical protein G6F65_020143 [Rhizopus arrhizus]